MSYFLKCQLQHWNSNATICLSTIFRTSSHDMPLRFSYEKLGEAKCKVLLGCHALTGCNQTGKFYGFSKLLCGKSLIPHHQKYILPYKV